MKQYKKLLIVAYIMFMLLVTGILYVGSPERSENMEPKSEAQQR